MAASPADIALASRHPASDAGATFHGKAVLSKGGRFEDFAFQPRPFGDEDVELRITDSGVCGSDVHCIDGGWGYTPHFPMVPGHEVVGVVTRVGSAVRHVKVDEVAGVGAQIYSCGKCESCLHGCQQTCPQIGMTYDWKWPDGQQAQGGYADRWRGPGKFVFRIPDKVSPSAAAPLLCAGITTYAPLARFGKVGQRIGIIGIGGLGHLALQFARALGHSKVTAISRTAEKEKAARGYGATDFLLSVDAHQLAAAKRSFDLLLFCAGDASTSAFDSYLDLLDAGGRIVILGLPDGVRLSVQMMVLVFAQLSVTGSVIGSPAEMRDMLELAAKCGVKPELETYPLKEVDAVVLRHREGKIRFRAVLQP